MRLTDLSIKSLPIPERGQKTYTDDVVPGFGVRVSQGGTRTFVLMHGQHRQLTTIGRVGIISLADARGTAKKILAEKTLGKHHLPTIGYSTAVQTFLTHCRSKNKPRTVKDYERLLGRFKFGKLGDITRATVSERLDRFAEAPSEQKHALVALKVFFSWCVRQGYLEHSPCEALRSPRTSASRERTLTTQEAVSVLCRSREAAFPYGTITALALLTGQRRGEIAALRWDWIDQQHQTITLPASITKNRREHTFPYGNLTRDILNALPRLGPYLFPASRTHVRNKPTTVFNAWGKSKQAFDAGLKNVGPYQFHDLRRTTATIHSSPQVGTLPHITERILNHVSTGQVSGVAAIYNRHRYIEEMRQAVDAYETFLQSLLARA